MTRVLPAVAALLLVAGCSGGAGSRETRTLTATGIGDGQTVTVAMTDRLAFDPSTVKAAVGALTLTIQNAGRVPHNLIFDKGALGHTDLVNAGQTVTLTVPLASAGTYTFQCSLHPGMTGKIVVSG